MNEPHVYSEGGVEWQRVFTVPTASVDGKVDAFSSTSFVEKTKNKKGTMGDLFDQAREASEKRAQVLGKDPVKEKSLKEWGKKRNNRVHPLLGK